MVMGGVMMGGHLVGVALVGGQGLSLPPLPLLVLTRGGVAESVQSIDSISGAISGVMNLGDEG